MLREGVAYVRKAVCLSSPVTSPKLAWELARDTIAGDPLLWHMHDPFICTYMCVCICKHKYRRRHISFTYCTMLNRMYFGHAAE